jgi:hypothetical protein
MVLSLRACTTGGITAFCFGTLSNQFQRALPTGLPTYRSGDAVSSSDLESLRGKRARTLYRSFHFLNAFSKQTYFLIKRIWKPDLCYQCLWLLYQSPSLRLSGPEAPGPPPLRHLCLCSQDVLLSDRLHSSLLHCPFWGFPVRATGALP